MTNEAMRKSGAMKARSKALAPAIIAVFLLVIVISMSSPALALTAKTLGDYGNVTVMEFDGDFNSVKADGTTNSEARMAVAKEFYRTHKDGYDFVSIFTTFDYQMPNNDSNAFYSHVRNDIDGIGQDIFDYSSMYGSDGKLQGTIDMGNLGKLSLNPMDARYSYTLSVLSHEIMHRWAANVQFRDASGAASSALLGLNGDHWSYLLDTDGSVLYGNDWRDNGDGTFTSMKERKYLSPLDKYLMGLIPNDQVPPMLLIQNPQVDATKLTEPGVTITGTPMWVTIDDIVAVEGERVPNYADAQKNFKMAFILLVRPGTFTQSVLTDLEALREESMTRFSILTDGSALVDVATPSMEAVLENPGVINPAVTPRTLPADINEGVQWLVSHQRSDGSWLDMDTTEVRDTSQAAELLGYVAPDLVSNLSGLSWLEASEVVNTDYLARTLRTLARGGRDVTALVSSLVAAQNTDGGWGSAEGYISNPLDTALALGALAQAGYNDASSISNALSYLASKTNTDGGWGIGDGTSSVLTTATAIMGLNVYRDGYSLNNQLAGGIAWLKTKQNNDGGFGNSPSTVYDTAAALDAIIAVEGIGVQVQKGVEFLYGTQADDGGWNASAYQTALAVEALWGATIMPDLAVDAASITFDPSSIDTIPSALTVKAIISNQGRTNVAQAIAALYDGDPSKGGLMVAETTIALPGMTDVPVSFTYTIGSRKTDSFYVKITPVGDVLESTTSNNMASKTLHFNSTYDLRVLSDGLMLSINPVDQNADVEMSVAIANPGTMDASSVPVKYTMLSATGETVDLGQGVVNVPAGGTATGKITWKAYLTGAGMPITVKVDPLNTFSELDEANNTATGQITVNEVVSPNLHVLGTDLSVSPTRINEGEAVSFVGAVRNDGNASASDVSVKVSSVGADGQMSALATMTIASIAPSEKVAFDIPSLVVSGSGMKSITVQADSDNQIVELDEQDNESFVTLDIRSRPDLEVRTEELIFSPQSAHGGELVHITAAVWNLGDQSASNVVVRIYDGLTAIGEQTIQVIESGLF